MRIVEMIKRKILSLFSQLLTSLVFPSVSHPEAIKKPNKPLYLTDILLFPWVVEGGLWIGYSLSSYIAKCGAKGYVFYLCSEII